MNSTSRTVIAVGGGYLLGRTRKLRFALVVGGAVSGRRLPTSVADLLAMGWKVVAVSPEFVRLGDAVRAQLLPVGRAAAIAAAGRQIEALTARLAAQVDTLTISPDTTAAATSPAPVAGVAEIEPAEPVGPDIETLAPVEIIVVEDDDTSRATENGHLIQGAHA